MMSGVRGYLVLSVTLLCCIQSLQSQSTGLDSCTSASTCGECLSMGPQCAWCMKESYAKMNYPRCDVIDNMLARDCGDEEYLYNQASVYTIIDDVDVRDAGDSGNDAVQVQPQRVSMTLRIHDTKRIRMKIRQAVDYPVDLYYLMDMSASMNDDLQNLKVLGTRLANRMSELTRNFHVGFGSFVDKVVMPYTNMAPAKLNEPCPDCEPPFGFHNLMSLSQDLSMFTATIEGQKISGNLDAPEGGLDAIMQATVCPEHIGWRDRSRHILVFTTDAAFHHAGDGKLGGIVTPNDETCHMTDDGFEYAASKYLDYPSVAQLNKVMQENNIQAIFAITEQHKEVYEKLSGLIVGSTAGVLANDSGNVVELVEENFNKITSQIRVTHQEIEDITVQYTAICNPNDQTIVQYDSDVCGSVGIGQTVTFDVDVTATACPANGESKVLSIKPVGMDEALLVELDFICDCDCEDPDRIEINSPNCNNGNGTYMCGTCDCYDGYSSDDCSCDQDQAESEDVSSCMISNTSEICQGRGACICGICNCLSFGDEQLVWGPFCECDNFNCYRYKGEICSGPDHGHCDCGQCVCEEGWIGNACECRDSNDTCIASNGILCNGEGSCSCGICTCFSDSKYHGQTCEDCPTCVSRNCKESWPCVQCRVFKSGDYSKEECDLHCTQEIIEVKDIEDMPGAERCVFHDDDKCTAVYTYFENSTEYILLTVQEDKVCPAIFPIIWLVLGILLGILLVGIVLLVIWKIVVVIQDRKEVAQFEKDKQNAKWHTGENPIYKQATTSFKNPMYGGSSSHSYEMHQPGYTTSYSFDSTPQPTHYSHSHQH